MQENIPIKKKCCHCEQIKPLTEFNKHPKTISGFHPRCKECRKLYRLGKLEKYRKYYKRYYKNNRKRILQYWKDNNYRFKERQRKYQNKQRLQKKELIVKEHGGKCAYCGYDNILGLDFHHVGKKRFSVNRAISTLGIEKIRAEAKKCILLCCACHRGVHAGLIQLKEGK